MKDIEQRISGAQIRLRMRHPFFATLALFATVRIGSQIETAATDGRSIWFNPDFVATLADTELDGLLSHEVLHAALLHLDRRGAREAIRWNIACDIVINGMLDEAGLTLPQGSVRDPRLQHLAAEEVYQQLLSRKPPPLAMADLMEPAGPDQDPLHERHRAEREGHWRLARDQARVVVDRLVEAGKHPGSTPWGASRDWQRVSAPEIDWRTVLWRFLVRTPVDYSGYDRRFIGQGLYLESLDGESVEVAICIDTSGSIGDEELNLFLAEVDGVLSSYPAIHCRLWYADAALYGPWSIEQIRDVPKPQGGGGTSFVYFIKALTDEGAPALGHGERLAVYLTDGYGDFPQDPGFPLLWVVLPGGLESDQFPFGMVTRLEGHR